MTLRRMVIRTGKAFLVLIVSLIVLSGGLWVYDTLMERGPGGFWNVLFPGKEGASFHLKEQPVYSIKSRQDVLGVRVFRIISHYQPQEFLIIDGLSRHAIEQIYGKPVDSFWANQVANQLIKVRTGAAGVGDGVSDAATTVKQAPISVEIQQIRAIGERHLVYARHILPYWQLEVKFKLSNESSPRYYQTGIIRIGEKPNAFDFFHPASKDTLVVGYAPRDAFQKDLLLDLLRHLDFSQDG
jgi:hypothetical protein